MATSGSYDFAITRDQIIQSALRKLNAISQFEDPSDKEITDGAEALNLIVKSWMSQGAHLWKYEQIVVFPEIDKTLYTLGPSGDNAALSSDVIDTTTTNSASTGATSLTVSSTTGMAASDFIGIQLSDASSQWTTIVSVDSSTTLTITDALTGEVSSGAQIYTYTTKIQKPMRLVDAQRRIDPTLKTDIRVDIIPKEVYEDLPNKASTGDLTQIYYEPKISSGNLQIWLSPVEVVTTLRATAEYPIEDFDDPSNNPDFPIEWAKALIFNLAVDLAPEYGNINDNTFQIVKQLADEYKMDALDYDVEYTSIQFVPGTDENFSFGR